MAATLIEKFPDEESINRAEEELIARNACGIAFAGESESFDCGDG
jgi:hypothetical protein